MRFKPRQRRDMFSSGLTWTDVYGNPRPATTNPQSVNEVTALRNAVVWRSVSLIADGVASLPPLAYTEDVKGNITPQEVPPWIKNPSGDPGIHKYNVWHQLMVSVLLWGNAYAILSRRPSDNAVNGMLCVDPAQVHCEWDPDNPGYRRYQINGQKWLDSSTIFHMQGLTLPGRATGMSVIAQAREAISLGLTLEQFGSRYFSQGSMAKVVLTIPTDRPYDDKQAAQLVKNYERFHRGPNNWHRPAVLTGPVGTKVENISIPPEDAQFLETREFQALDIARWFGVPPHRVGIISKQSSWGSGLEEENTALVQTTYRRYILCFEEAFTAYAPGGDAAGMKIRLNDYVMTRGTLAEQVKMLKEGVDGQIYTPNEARKLLGLPPVEGGDKLTTAISKGALIEATKPVDNPNEPAPAPVQKAAPTDAPGKQPPAPAKGA